MSTVILCHDSQSALKSGAMEIFPRGRSRELFTGSQWTGEIWSVEDVTTLRTLSVVTARRAAGGTDRYTHKRDG
jgi:hypothetical protein